MEGQDVSLYVSSNRQESGWVTSVLSNDLGSAGTWTLDSLNRHLERVAHFEAETDEEESSEGTEGEF